MAYTGKTWKNRIVQYPNRRTLTDTNSESTVYTVARNEGEITQEGDAFSAENMNDLESRIANGFTAVEPEIATVTLQASSWSNGTYTIYDERIHVNNTQETTQVLMPARGITEEQLEALVSASIIDYSQDEGIAVFKAMGDVPAINIPVRIQFRGYY